MGKYFTDKTEEAVKLLYTQYDQDEFRRAQQLLMDAANEGDADALYFLSRCNDKSFIWEYAGFPENEETAIELMQQSVIRGSACGVLGALRMRGALTPTLREKMPFASLREAFDIVLEKATAGHPFCQYMIGNAYCWGDIAEIDKCEPSEISRKEAEWNAEGIKWFEKSILGGYYWGAKNLMNHYRKGAPGVPKDMEKYRYWLQYCADGGSPEYQEQLADVLYNEKKYEESLRYYRLSAEKGQMPSWCGLGYQYQKGEGTDKDERYALQCYEKAAASGYCTAQYNTANMLYKGEGGEVDYARAAYYFDQAAKQGDKDAIAFMGECYLKGHGVEQNYALAKTLFEQTQEKVKSLNGLGDIYTEGKGVPEDIGTGVGFYKKAADMGSQIGAGNVARFKKSLFGGWKRR